MALEVNSGDCQTVRDLIDVTLTEDNLSNDTILKPVYKDSALAYVKARTLNDDEHAQRAVLYVLAAKLVKVVPKVTAEHLPGSSLTRQSQDWDKHESDLWDEAGAAIALSEQLNKTIVETEADAMPEMFSTAPARY